MSELYEGQLVRIIGGSYKHNGTGIFIERCGKVSARVKVTGDNQSERTLRLSSIEAVLPGKPKFFNTARNFGTTSNKGDLSDEDIRRMGQWVFESEKYYDPYMKEKEKDNKWKKQRRVLQKCYREYAKLVVELQDKVNEMKRIIDDMN
jgi:hypothetical protein